MTNKKQDLLYNLENIKMVKEKKDKYFNDTIKYQKKYGFGMGTGEHATWNNEADAFKHAYMSAHSRYLDGEFISKTFATLHERNGNKYYGQPKGEENMDKWNNEIGQQIGAEVLKEFKDIKKNFSKEQIEDWIAHKVMEKLRNGDLITSPNDKRDYNQLINTHPTGFATPIAEQNHIFTPQEIGKMTPEEFSQNESAIMQQMKDGLIKNQQPKIDYSNYKNPISDHKEIFTREDIAKMSTKEFSKHEKAINAQMKDIGIPYKKDLPKNATTHTERKEKLQGNNSSEGKWVTINGNHVLLDK